MSMTPAQIVLHPFVTEKTMSGMEKDNKLEFIVHRTANKRQIKAAIETLFAAKVADVNTRFATDGQKHAVVRFKPETKAEDVGMRIGIF